VRRGVWAHTFKNQKSCFELDYGIGCAGIRSMGIEVERKKGMDGLVPSSDLKCGARTVSYK
jgi:hypothetical protein